MFSGRKSGGSLGFQTTWEAFLVTGVVKEVADHFTVKIQVLFFFFLNPTNAPAIGTENSRAETLD